MPVYNERNVPESVGRGTLDPELEAWLPTGPVMGADAPIAVGRREHEKFAVKPWGPIGSVKHLVLDGPHGSLPVRALIPSSPRSAAMGALVYIHGGGFTYGTLDQFETAMRLIAERSGVAMYIVDYQLAPEAKFPVQIDEIEYVVRWLFEHASEEGVDPAKIGLGGDSAGGNMTAALTLKLRNEEGPKLALQVPLYPEAAFPGDTKAFSENRQGYYLESNGIFEFVRNLTSNGDDVASEYLTPLNAESHSDLPPTILVTNGFDPLRDVGLAYAHKLAGAGNNLTYIHHPHLTHGFIQMTRWSQSCEEATEQLAELIGQKLG